jgi:hypothetical protein
MKKKFLEHVTLQQEDHHTDQLGFQDIHLGYAVS